MSTTSYSNVNTIEKEREYLGRRLDKYAKFYWRGEDMWATYHTFITNNGSALKFVNGPSFSNEYSSPQYDHAMGNLTGVKFTRMQVSFTICSYGVTAKEYRSLIAALGPYEIDYLAFDYDDKLCYLAKTTGMKEAVKYVVGVSSNGEDLYMVENNVTFEVQGEQCALAQRQYVWVPGESTYPSNNKVTTRVIVNNNDMLSKSEIPFGIVGEITVEPAEIQESDSLPFIKLYIPEDGENKIELCAIFFNKTTKNWQNIQVDSTEIGNYFSIKYDSTSGLVFMQYGESDYKILDLLLTNTYGEYLIKDIQTTKMKIDKDVLVGNIPLVWELRGFNFKKKDREIKIGCTSTGTQCYIKKIKIDNVEYLFGQYSTYQHLPNFKIGGTGEGLVDQSTGPWTQIKPNSYISFNARGGNNVQISIYYPQHTWYEIDSEGQHLVDETTQPIDFEIPVVDELDKTTIQIYGRAKAILV